MVILVVLALVAGHPHPPVELLVQRESAGRKATTYRYLLRNNTSRPLHHFLIGLTLSDSCPELHELPVAWRKDMACPKSIVAPKPWRGCVNFAEECDGLFLEFDFPFHSTEIASGDSLAFAVTIPKPDPAYERALFWIADDASSEYTARATARRPRLTGGH